MTTPAPTARMLVGALGAGMLGAIEVVMTKPTPLDVAVAELELVAGGVHVLADACQHRGDADLGAQVRILARMVEAVLDRLGRVATKGAE